MARFVQIIEFQTSHIDEVRALVTDLRTQIGPGDTLRATLTEDRDRPGWYLNIVEFESRDAAMANSARREVSDFAARMTSLCDGPPRYYNLDVLHTWSGARAQKAKSMLVGTATAAAGVAAAGVGKARQQLGDVRGRIAERSHVGHGPTPTSAGRVQTGEHPSDGEPPSA